MADAQDIVVFSHDSQHGRTVEQSNILRVEEQSRDFIRDIADLLQERNSSSDEANGNGKPWIFGDTPTILDAHAATLIARIIDLERFDLVSEPARVYASAVMETNEWKQVAHGRPTIWNDELGPVEDLDPL